MEFPFRGEGKLSLLISDFLHSLFIFFFSLEISESIESTHGVFGLVSDFLFFSDSEKLVPRC